MSRATCEASERASAPARATPYRSATTLALANPLQTTAPVSVLQTTPSAPACVVARSRPVLPGPAVPPGIGPDVRRVDDVASTPSGTIT